MNFRTTVLIIFVISAAILMCNVEATRILCEDLGSSNYQAAETYEKVKYTMSYWLQRLPTGSSDKGGGH
ncbi:hypothetical protein CIPAW_01G171900 [Carya illinoinensis]|uniref:Uncharacterized protein n=1 Tax=Carya illinoinensis TaxID=32201 RepID=A0A8T1RP24_CARIL|nr:hypothetical protein CIPAW_01G171900 [Carya illinoinensis]